MCGSIRIAARINPDSWIGHHSLALHYEAAGELDLALHHADVAIRCKSGSSESYTARAKIHAARGELEPALRDLDRAVELDPT